MAQIGESRPVEGSAKEGGEKKDPRPTYTRAKEHFETFICKRIKETKESNNYRLAFAGETQNADGSVKAERYSFFGSAAQLNEFGIGISLYFHTLKALFIVLLICAFVSMIAIYENRKFNNRFDGTSPPYSNNATCPIELQGSTYNARRQDLQFDRQGASDIIVVAILTVFLIVAAVVEKWQVERIDVAEQTTSDYAVMVTNPPPDAFDPHDYYKWFSRFGEVVYVCVTVRNGTLLKAYADKLVLQERLEGVPYRPAWKAHFPFVYPPLSAMQAQMAALDAKIEALCDPKQHARFRPYKVFAIYNTEKAKRDCIDSTNTSYLDYLRQDTSNPQSKFHGRVLWTTEPREPSDFLYESTDVSFLVRLLSWAASFLVSAAFIIISFFIIVAIQNNGGADVAIFLTISNSVLPSVMLYSTMYIECHTMESQRQASILVKLFVMRCINSGVLIFLAVKYEEVFSAKHLAAIQGILIADATYTPLLRGLDASGLVWRWVVSPLISNTQDEMNDYWRGTDWTLAERYTDMLKSAFVGIFFLVPLPSSLFISSFAMVATYIVDKYCLYNIWRRPPALDSMSYIARYGFGVSIFAHICVSRAFFVNWPYATLSEEDRCDFLTCPNGSYLTEDQRRLNSLYSGCAAAFLAMVIFWIFLYEPLLGAYQALFAVDTAHVGEANDDKFRDTYGLNPYIPLVNKYELEDAVLSADVSCLPFEAVPVNVWDEEDELPQDLSIADIRRLPFLEKVPNYPERIKELFGEVVYFAPNGTPCTAKTQRPGKEEIRRRISGIDLAAVKRLSRMGSAGNILGVIHGKRSSHDLAPSAPGYKDEPAAAQDVADV